MCVLNGRYDPVHDDFTCVSGRGKSVVDYICVPHDALKLIESFQVITARSIVENFNLFEFLGERSKVPDHSVILTEFKTYEEANESYQVTSSLPKRYKLNSIPNDFLASDMRKTALQTLIFRIETTRENQTNMDNIYDLCNIIIDEMNAKIQFSTLVERQVNVLKWENLIGMTILAHCGIQCVIKKKDFLNSERCERQFRHSFCVEVENMTTSNPNEFWEKIKKLGPRKTQRNPDGGIWRRWNDSHG
ncbi:Hypothetical predicted protein [Mytilus galloprovincialis]|uniref:Uncharacterized protein n=1 Tax=Mytilus galloprovincialis TaxID=29158 RepID=A0A8B6H564_MYTGA|nr:Hypothetical predicted protein [Mytilus galloprovincialis]